MSARFHTKLIFEDDGGLPFILVAPLVFESLVLGRTITVPAGFATDLASIPQILENILPRVGRYDAAAVIHDLLYQRGNVDGTPIARSQADAVLREGMDVCGVSAWKRWAIYAGVRAGGWVVWRKYRKDVTPKVGPLAAAALLLALWTAPAAAQAPRMPDATLTPGATREVTLKALCTPGSAGKARAVTSATKRQVFARYHVTPKPGAYEIDHLISLELGGSNDIANLWPQPYHGALNAHDKDRLENQLHALVCKGTVPLDEAQHAIATDWVAAMQKYGGKSGPR